MSASHIPALPNNNPDVTRILVVDADPSVADMIRDHFAAEGYYVESYADSDRIYSLDLANYNLVLLDLGIDNDSGLALIEHIKQIYEPYKVAVIAYSTQVSPEIVIHALNAGAEDYLIKPFSIRELKARIRSVLRRC